MQTGYSIAEIHRVLGSSLALKNRDRQISELLIDSRRLNQPEKTLFFALTGERHDGHRFVRDLYQKGVRNFVISQLPRGFEKMQQANFIKVSNTLSALQILAAFHRKQFDIPVVGITGSNGKTVVKEWLYQLLNHDQSIVRSPKSFNSQVGVPLSVWQLNPSHDLAFFEAGISQPGEMKRLAEILHPTIGVFTHLGDAHGEHFASDAEKVDEKLLLFRDATTLYYGKDQKTVHARIEANAFLQDKNLVTWSAEDEEATLFVTATTPGESTTTIQGRFAQREISITIPYTDKASVENATLCWLILLDHQLADSLIVERMKRLATVRMRLEMKEGVNRCTLINDSYNSDVGSLKIALEVLQHQHQHVRKTLILSDILEADRQTEELYRQVADLVNAQPLDRLIGIGAQLSAHQQLFQVDKQQFFADTEAFLMAHSSMDFQREAVLIKGARSFEFERIDELLQQQSHETVLEINLNALVENLNYFRSKLQSGTKLMVMVKAFSYGSGSYEIANVLQFHRVDYLGVAYADEGVELRKAGITIPIMVMSPEEASFDDLLLYNLEPEIYNLSLLKRFARNIRENHLSDRLPFPIHLKLDTGMHRLGLEEQDLEEVLALLQDDQCLQVQSVFSHLAASGSPEHEEFTAQQIERFQAMSDRISQSLDYPFLRHIANTAAITHHPEAQFDMVRLGIGLHGLGADEAEDAALTRVGTLKTSIIQVKHIKAGETIGYGRAGKATEDMTTATVAIGYADGLNRNLGNGVGQMIVRGQRVSTIGAICMDMCMLDMTGIPVQEGDEVIVFGQELSIREVAAKLKTIPYEILTSISRRVKRVYFQE